MRLPYLAAVVLLLTLPAFASAQDFDPAARAAAVAPYLDNQAFAVAHVDLSKIKLGELRKLLVEKVPIFPKEALASMERDEKLASDWIAALHKAGAQDAYVVLSLAELPQRPPFAVVRLAKDTDVDQLKKLILRGPQQEDAPISLAIEMIGKNLVLGHATTLSRLKELKATDKPALASAFKAAGDTDAQVIVLASADTRRVLTEALPRLPAPLDDYSGKDLAPIQFAAIGFHFPPKLATHVTVQTSDEASATRLRGLVVEGLKQVGAQQPVRELFPKFDELARLLTPKQQGEQLSIVLNEENGGVAGVVAMLAPPLQAARKTAQRMQSSNNLKQMGLAMHNYHDTFGSFPAAATTKEGKSLLSWRVQVLPFLDQVKLYNEFHHDEPWDSEHNLKLLEKMPSVFASTALDLKPGHTAYLVPTGEGMIFHGDQKTKISAITDGTSNTILIVEANADRAVPWTKPADLAIDLENPLAGLGNVYDKEGFLVLIADGSVKFIAKAIDLKTLRHLFEMADGHPVGPY